MWAQGPVQAAAVHPGQADVEVVGQTRRQRSIEQQRLPGVLLNGALRPRLPHNLNISLPGVNGSRLHRALRPQLACSSGSACSNGAPSHVLQAIGRSRAEAEASLRLSLGRDTTAAEVEQAIDVILNAVAAATV